MLNVFAAATRSSPALLMAAALLFPQPALAEDPISLGQFNCTTANCEGLLIQGRTNSNGAISNPWVAQVWAASGGNFCARLRVVKQSANLEMSVVGPDGTIYTANNNGGAACPACPRVVIKPVALRGVYTVVINTADGAPAEATFQLQMGQYPIANVNCNNNTQPSRQAASRAEAAKYSKLQKN
jgi:hypothetical protein